jgi:hypothetical protein
MYLETGRSASVEHRAMAQKKTPPVIQPSGHMDGISSKATVTVLRTREVPPKTMTVYIEWHRACMISFTLRDTKVLKLQ